MQLKAYTCQLCEEHLTEEYATVQICEDDVEKRYYFCSPECMFSTFMVMFVLSSEAPRNMHKLVRKLSKPKKKSE